MDQAPSAALPSSRGASRIAWHVMHGVLFALVLVSSAVRADEGRAGADLSEAPSHSPWFIGPGQERAAARMLGGGSTIAGCRYETAALRRDSIVAEFRCADGVPAFVIEMTHASGGLCRGTCSEQFEIIVTDGAPPPAFLPALVRSVRAHEADFVWGSPGGALGGPAFLRPLYAHKVPVLFGAVLAFAACYLIVERLRGAK